MSRPVSGSLRAVLLVGTLLACCGCAQALFYSAFNAVFREPIVPATLPSQTAVLDVPRGVAFHTIITTLRDQGYRIRTQDPGTGRIETELKPWTPGVFRPLVVAGAGFKGFSDAWLIELESTDRDTTMMTA